jgi:hypothetical protein
MKKRHIASIVMVAMVVLAAFSIIPVSAPGNPGAGCTSETKFYGTIHGGIYFEQLGFTPVCGEESRVKVASLT